MTRVVIDIGWHGELRLTNDAIREFFKRAGIEFIENMPHWAAEDEYFRKEFWVEFPGDKEPDLANRILKNHRANPILIELIEGWGEKAALEGCEPRIVEIPDNVEWEIASGDVGQEWIQEKHRTWGFKND